MIKYYCDRCGKELNREKRIGYVSVNTKDRADGDLQEDNEFEKWHFCKECTEAIRRFVRKAPECDQNSEKVLKNQEKCTESVEKRTETDEKCAENEEIVSEDTPAPKKKFDVGKIIALKKAGWKVKDIADEMHMTAQQVSNQIYLHNKKMQEHGAETEVHMSRIYPSDRPKL